MYGRTIQIIAVVLSIISYATMVISVLFKNHVVDEGGTSWLPWLFIGLGVFLGLTAGLLVWLNKSIIGSGKKQFFVLILVGVSLLVIAGILAEEFGDSVATMYPLLAVATLQYGVALWVLFTDVSIIQTQERQINTSVSSNVL